MSELKSVRFDGENLRKRLLLTASALVMIAVTSSHDRALAEEDDHPTVWIELGGQLARVDGGQELFAPAFVQATPRPAPEKVSPLRIGHAPRFSFGGEGKISFEPHGTDWVFSAAVRYGRSEAHKHLHQQSYPTHPAVPPITPSAAVLFQYALPFSDADRKESESHAVLDFQAGKDVGLGMFGRGSTSVFSFGVRFAQFSTRSDVTFGSQPDFHVSYKYFGSLKAASHGHFHENAAAESAARSFHGIGPSLAWNASTPVAGNIDEGQLALDWGINAAVLFGRQKARVHHQTTARYESAKYHYYSATRVTVTTLYHHSANPVRSRSVIVPNVGGFAGLSMRYGAAKVSFGYRADLFFDAMDGGIDAHKSYSRSFYGPFATVSIGLGG